MPEVLRKGTLPRGNLEERKFLLGRRAEEFTSGGDIEDAALLDDELSPANGIANDSSDGLIGVKADGMAGEETFLLGQCRLGGAQSLVECLQSFGDDPLVADGGHEIGIADPAGNDVEMEMVIDSGSGGFAKIPADIKSLRFHAFLEQGLGVTTEMPEFEDFLFGEVTHVRDLSVGDRHEMPGRVGIPVHDEKGLFAADHDEVSGVIAGLGGLTKKIRRGGIFGLKIFYPPRCPERFEVVFGKGIGHRRKL